MIACLDTQVSHSLAPVLGVVYVPGIGLRLKCVDRFLQKKVLEDELPIACRKRRTASSANLIRE